MGKRIVEFQGIAAPHTWIESGNGPKFEEALIALWDADAELDAISLCFTDGPVTKYRVRDRCGPKKWVDNGYTFGEHHLPQLRAACTCGDINHLWRFNSRGVYQAEPFTG